MDVLSSFVFQVKGVMYYSYSVCGARLGDNVTLVRQPYDRHDTNCIDVVFDRARASHKIGRVAAEVAAFLSPLLRDAPLEASG